MILYRKMTGWHYVRLVLVTVGIILLTYAIAHATIVDFDFRERGRTPVAIEVVTVTVDYDVHTQVGTATITTNGLVEQIVITIPDLNVTSASAKFKLRDENGVVLGQTPDPSEDFVDSNLFTQTSRVFRPAYTVLLAGTTTVEIETSEAQTEDQDITVEFYLR